MDAASSTSTASPRPGPDGERGALFDLDGTLLDTAELVLDSFAHAWTSLVGRVPERRLLLATFGTPLPQAIRDLVGEEARHGRLPATLPPERAERLLYRRYLDYQDEHHDAYVRAFPGVDRTLRTLQRAGVRLALVTSKRRHVAERGYALAGLPDVFHATVYPEDCSAHKPDPTPLRLALERLGVDAEAAIYVGDAPADMAAARAAGVAAVGALWGPAERDDLAAAGAQLFVDHPDQIPDLL